MESKHCPAICSTLASLWNVATHKIQCSSAVAGGLAMQRISVRHQEKALRNKTKQQLMSFFLQE